tara:strand:- start:463 stop:1959 length:1497 start_codon:yes stop_codon:yes gene_type:complete
MNKKFSVSPLTNKSFQIPKNNDDSVGLNEFLSHNKEKKIIVVQGLGFVGAVMSLVCANAIHEDYAVIGIDLASQESFWKIKSINEGDFPLIADDPKIEEFFENTKIKKNFYATYDPSAYSYADIIIVDINLDVQKNSLDDYSIDSFDVDLSSFKQAISVIGKNMNPNALIIVETTVPPGTCQNIVKPIIEAELKIRESFNDQIFLGHSYERVMPGPEYIDSIRCYPRVYSGINKLSADKVEKFLNTIIDVKKCTLTRLEHTNATEIAKVLENSYRATNIAFAIEWSRFAEEAGVDLYSIVHAIRERDTHSNLMFPGVGVGGYCLTKDPLLASWARKNFFDANDDLEMSIGSVSKNDMMPVFAFKRAKIVFGDFKNKNVLFFGVSYRGDVGDTRYSPVKNLVDLVKKDGANIELHDPFIPFWEEINSIVEIKLDKALSSRTDMIIISTNHKQYSSDDTIKKIMSMKQIEIFDTVGALKEHQLEKLSKKHKVSVLGRGDY